MAETLNEIERRIIGVLLEKSLAQPQYYPMTINAIVTACNQKSNRDPMMTLDEDVVWDTLERLRVVGLVTRLMPGGASRVDRFKHEVKTLLGWEKPQWAVMAELLLRGPQTVGELRTRCRRLFEFDSPDQIPEILDNFAREEPPRVEVLPRGAGQSAVRYAHRLYPPEEWEKLSQVPAGAAPVAASTPAPAKVQGDLEALLGEMREIQADVAGLREQLDELRARVENLEG